MINPALFSIRKSSQKVVKEVFSFINAFSFFDRSLVEDEFDKINRWKWSEKV